VIFLAIQDHFFLPPRRVAFVSSDAVATGTVAVL